MRIITNLEEALMDNPIIAAVSSREKLKEAVEASPCEIIFILESEILTLKKDVNYVLEHDKLVFVHMDLISGLSHDVHALAYIHEEIKPTGILTTKASLVKKAKELNLYVIQRLFMLDSKSLRDGIASIKKTLPDGVEIMPGIATMAITEINQKTRKPVIAGGLIESKQQMMEALKAGAVSVSTSKSLLWES